MWKGRVKNIKKENRRKRQSREEKKRVNNRLGFFWTSDQLVVETST
jgi:hypothetical protein